MEWKAHLKSSSLEEESRLDAQWTFLLCILVWKPNCHLGFFKPKEVWKFTSGCPNETIDYKDTKVNHTLNLTFWTFLHHEKFEKLSRIKSCRFSIHSFHDKKIGHFHAVVFFSVFLWVFKVFKVVSRVTENLANFACNPHDFLMGSTKCGVITTLLDYLRRFT